MLDLNVEFRMGKRFRFEAFWPKADGFFEVVTETWDSIPSEGNPFVTLDNKLRATAKALQRWSDRWIGNVKMQISIALEIIYRLDKAMDSRSLSQEEGTLRKTLKRKLLGLCSLERSIARQRSRLLYLREGDANTNFFHRHARHRQRKNSITVVRRGDEIFSGHEHIAAAVGDYFEGIFGTA